MKTNGSWWNTIYLASDNLIKCKGNNNKTSNAQRDMKQDGSYFNWDISVKNTELGNETGYVTWEAFMAKSFSFH